MSCVRIFGYFYFVLATSFIVNGQANPLDKVGCIDSIVSTMILNTEHDPANLAWTLEEPFVTDSQKVRAVFFWITQNIAYDVASFAKGIPAVPFDAEKDENVTQWHYRRIVHTLITKKGVCEEYALLFQFMCKTLKIPCEVITGYALTTRPTELHKLIINEEASNHAWNAVKINGKWYLVDCTFASGSVNSLNGKFVRNRNEFYYLTPPELFILDHHPVMSNWQLLDNPLNIKAFIDNAKYNRENSIGPERDTIVINK